MVQCLQSPGGCVQWMQQSASPVHRQRQEAQPLAAAYSKRQRHEAQPLAAGYSKRQRHVLHLAARRFIFMPPLTCSVAARECSDLLGERWEVDQKELGLWWDGEQAGRAGWAVVRDGHGGAGRQSS